jgi:hypothetical protein
MSFIAPCCPRCKSSLSLQIVVPTPVQRLATVELSAKPSLGITSGLPVYRNRTMRCDGHCLKFFDWTGTCSQSSGVGYGLGKGGREWAEAYYPLDCHGRLVEDVF